MNWKVGAFWCINFTISSYIYLFYKKIPQKTFIYWGGSWSCADEDTLFQILICPIIRENMLQISSIWYLSLRRWGRKSAEKWALESFGLYILFYFSPGWMKKTSSFSPLRRQGFLRFSIFVYYLYLCWKLLTCIIRLMVVKSLEESWTVFLGTLLIIVVMLREKKPFLYLFNTFSLMFGYAVTYTDSTNSTLLCAIICSLFF